jgi:transcriptional regulator with XRE-family HTH domain
MDEQGQRERLAQMIRVRRLELGLSATKAAQAAGIDRATWSNAETGTRRTLEHNHVGIERALSWRPGSIEAILAGGEPTPEQTDGGGDEELHLVRTDPQLTPEMRDRIIALILERRERERSAAVEDTRRLIALFKRG